MIRLFHVGAMGTDITERISRVIASGHIAQGPIVDEFERELAIKFLLDHDRARVVTVNSGTSAIHLALVLAGVGPGDDVAVSPMTCSASIVPILHLGARPVWIDVDPKTGLMDPADLYWHMTKRTKAVIAIDWAGTPCDYDRIHAAANGVTVIQDAAHAFLARDSDGALIYTHATDGPNVASHLIAHSFQAIKHLTTGDGGALIVPAELAERAKRLRWFGFDRTSSKDFRCAQDLEEAGYKFHCLHRHTRVALPDGSTRTIMDLVASKYSGEVMSVTKDGRVVPKKVVGWHRSGRGDRGWVFLSHEFSPGRRGGKKTRLNNERQGVWLTEDHRVLTSRGYVPAGQLLSTDLLVTADFAFTQEQRELLLGTLLGDGCITKHIERAECARFACTHSIKQIDWLAIKHSMLRNFVSADAIVSYETRLHGKQYQLCGFQSASRAAFSELRARFYRPKKVVPRDLCSSEITDRVLATWFMDDGMRNGNGATLCTDGFTVDDVERLRAILATSGITTTRQTHQGKPRIGVPSRSPFFERVAPFIIPALRYKLPLEIAEQITYRPSLWRPDLTNAPRMLARPIVLRDSAPPGPERAVYCIDVEDTHNFIVNGGSVVHNCNDITAAIGLANLPAAEQAVWTCREHALDYFHSFHDLAPRVEQAPYAPGSSYWLYTILVDDRARFQAYMTERGIETSQVHRRNDGHSVFRLAALGHVDGWGRPLPGVDEFARHQVSIPVGWHLTARDREQIINAVRSYALQP